MQSVITGTSARPAIHRMGGHRIESSDDDTHNYGPGGAGQGAGLGNPRCRGAREVVAAIENGESIV
eukprot:7993394-Pyramimonas_sp.AAC.1